MMGDRKALQSGTSHNLGQNFAKAFDIKFTDESNELQFCWTTSWGLSTRMVGAIIMVHGDDKGLVMPPRLAPTQVVIVPIYKTDAERAQVMSVVDETWKSLKGSFRVKVDDREGFTPGFKFNDWEMRGVPVRIEIGPKDVASGNAVLARRDIAGREGKTIVPREGLKDVLAKLLDDIHNSLYQRALNFRNANTFDVNSYDEFLQAIENGFVRAWWCGDADCEAAIKEQTKATTRCIPFDQPGGTGICIRCGNPATEQAIFARSY
jgi:prolyl-tRNA synthetase